MEEDILANIARIKPIKKMACPSCRQILNDFSVEGAASGEPQACTHCGQKVKLPNELVQRAKQQRFLGNNLDITC